MRELIEFYSVFGGLKGYKLTPDDGLEQNIYNVYIKHFHSLKNHFTFTKDENFNSQIQTVLTKLSQGDRKKHSIYKEISQPKGKQIYKFLYENQIIREEQSQEKKPLRIKGVALKKHLRHYHIENKIHFNDESTRFWFNFIAPNIELIRHNRIEKLQKIIQERIESHISLSFEILCEELIKKLFFSQKIISSGSFWDKKNEIDLLIKTQLGAVIVGESKWKSRKICKNVLNSLMKKAMYADLHPTHFALFSKSGFSKEVKNMKNDNLLLFDLDDFKGLLDGQ